MIALGCDHGGYELMQEVKKHLEERGLEYKDFGCNGPESVDYPVYGKKVAQAIVDGECEKGILICGTGIPIRHDIICNLNQFLHISLHLALSLFKQ